MATFVNSFNVGDVAFDVSGPIDEASARINTTALSFTRAFSFSGRPANIGVALPIVAGDIEGRVLENRRKPAGSGRAIRGCGWR